MKLSSWQFGDWKNLSLESIASLDAQCNHYTEIHHVVIVGGIDI